MQYNFSDLFFNTLCIIYKIFTPLLCALICYWYYIDYYDSFWVQVLINSLRDILQDRRSKPTRDLRREWMVIYFSRLLYFCHARAVVSFPRLGPGYTHVSGWTTHQSRLTLSRNTTCGLFLSLRDAVSGRSHIRDRIESILSLLYLA